jgi:16S rRNA (guanine966-N2)-methyltransferase
VVAGGAAADSTAQVTAQVHATTVEQWIARRQAGSGYDVVFCDPPYSMGVAEVRAALETLRQRGLLADGAVVVVERGVRDPAWIWPQGFEAIRDRRYGEAHLWVGGLVGD